MAWASPPRPSDTTCSTSTRRQASAAALLRRSGPSSTSSFTAHRAFARCAPVGPRRYSPRHRCRTAAPRTAEEAKVILATTQIEDYDRFVSIFSTKGADKRRQHGSKGAQVFRDPNEEGRVWVLFDWDADGRKSFVSDPEVPPIMKEAGHKGPPQAAELSDRFDA